jgi:hypothetical protein
MTSPTFTHLRIHSEYSIVDGLVRIDELVKAAVKDGQPALAVTDLANTFCLVRFYKEARGKGVKPIVGVDAWITNDDNRPRITPATCSCATCWRVPGSPTSTRAAPNCAPNGSKRWPRPRLRSTPSSRRPMA